MIKVCLNFKIHIPSVRVLNAFGESDSAMQDNSDSETEKNITESFATSLLPYLRGLESLHLQSKSQFKAGLSINGITLTQLLKHAPEVIDQLKMMHEKECIEILSEPWSHSIVSFFDSHSLIRQIKLHDISIESVFGVIPEIFIVHSPAYLPHFLNIVDYAGKKAVFTNLNQLNNKACKKFVMGNANQPGESAVIPINYKISKMLQEFDFYLDTPESSGFSKRIAGKFKNYVPDTNPVIAVYNLTQTNNTSYLSKTIAWQKFLRDLLFDNKIIFTSPSESAERYRKINHSNNLLNNVFYRSKLEDNWLENKFQNLSFERQLRINTLMYDVPCKELKKEWDVLQDMENLFYMNVRFKKNRFSRHHFNFYDDPEKAFSSYMKVLENFMNKLLERKQESVDTIKN